MAELLLILESLGKTKKARTMVKMAKEAHPKP